MASRRSAASAEHSGGPRVPCHGKTHAEQISLDPKIRSVAEAVAELLVEDLLRQPATGKGERKAQR